MNAPTKGEYIALPLGDLASDAPTYGTVVAFRVLPSILFFSALSALLYHWGILQRIVYLLAWLMKRTMKISGAECLAMSANVFVGQTEAPLLVRPYLDKMSKSEILCLMTGGFATIAGGVFAAYVAFLGGTDPESQAIFAKHLLIGTFLLSIFVISRVPGSLVLLQATCDWLELI